LRGLVLDSARGREGTSDDADEVTLSRKGAKRRTHARKLRSTGTKVKPRVGRMRAARSSPEKQLRRELAEAREQQTATLEVLHLKFSR
jgi:hypothetical protein